MTNNKWWEDMAKLAGNAFGTLSGMKEEMENAIKQQIQHYMSACNMVTREEFEVVKTMAAEARLAQEQLEQRIAALEAQAASGKSSHE